MEAEPQQNKKQKNMAEKLPFWGTGDIAKLTPVFASAEGPRSKAPPPQRYASSSLSIYRPLDAIRAIVTRNPDTETLDEEKIQSCWNQKSHMKRRQALKSQALKTQMNMQILSCLSLSRLAQARQEQSMRRVLRCVRRNSSHTDAGTLASFGPQDRRVFL